MPGGDCSTWARGGGEEDSRKAVSTPAHQGSLWADAPGFTLVPRDRARYLIQALGGDKGQVPSEALGRGPPTFAADPPRRARLRVSVAGASPVRPPEQSAEKPPSAHHSRESCCPPSWDAPRPALALGSPSPGPGTMPCCHESWPWASGSWQGSGGAGCHRRLSRPQVMWAG